jgi:ATP-dependent 26S proteasome regulatory subunit
LEEKPKKVIFLRGVEEKISEIQSIISLSLSNQPIFEKSGLNPVKGLIIQGPPGTGKS